MLLTESHDFAHQWGDADPLVGFLTNGERDINGGGQIIPLLPLPIQQSI